MKIVSNCFHDSIREGLFISPIILLFEEYAHWTKLAIQNKAQRFLAGRSQDLGAFKNKLVLAKFFHAFEKNLLLLLAYLPYVRVKQHFPLISEAHPT